MRCDNKRNGFLAAWLWPHLLKLRVIIPFINYSLLLSTVCNVINKPHKAMAVNDASGRSKQNEQEWIRTSTKEGNCTWNE